MENDYIKIIILPEVGGKIWSATDKTTGKDFVYNNHVVKFRDIAMRGPGLIFIYPNSLATLSLNRFLNKHE